MLSETANFDKKLMKEKIEERLLAHMRGGDYQPQNKSELARALDLPSDQQSELRRALRDLEDAGTLLRARKGRFVLREADERTVLGRYRKHPRHGELIPACGEGSDAASGGSPGRSIRVPSHLASTALDGDQVVIRLRPAERRTTEPHWLKHLPKDKQAGVRERWQDSSPQPEGEVIKVVRRGHRAMVGTLQGRGRHALFHPDDEDLPRRIDLPEGLPEGTRPGDKALVQIRSWDSVGETPKGEVVRVLGAPDDPGVDVLAIIHQAGLPTQFPEDVLREAEALQPEILAAREDWREAEVITIDPFDAKDFDDAIGIKPLPSGGWELAVHIADVAHFVRPGSALDHEARARGNSVYLVDRVLPMLPERLSNGICSLKPGEDRLTFAAILAFDAKGRRLSSRFVKSLIRSRKRLAYEEALERLSGTGPDDETTVFLRMAWDLASRLRRRRFRQGSLNLDFPETKILLDECGRPREIRQVENDRSHQLIEEFMLAANEAVAERILQSERPCLYRIHEDPDPDRLMEFGELAKEHGYNPGDLTQREELQRLLSEIDGRPNEAILRLALLKSLKRAVYHPEARGHYGLAKEHYTHFTSPIRRYTDLVVHRVLQQVIDSGAAVRTPSAKEMEELGEHLSDTERVAAEAELATQRLKILEYFQRRQAESPGQGYRALITEVKRMGLFAELCGFGIRGLIRVQDLPGDTRYRFEPHRLRFHAGKDRSYRVGDELEVQIARIDPRKGFIDLRPVSS